MWYVYLIENKEGVYYCGSTVNILNRLAQHNGEKPGGAKFTKRGRPWKMVFYVEVESRSEAYKLESRVKKAKKSNKLRVMQYYIPE